MKKPTKKQVLICVGLFFFFLLIQFPFKNFRGQLFEKIYKSSGILISSDDIGLSFFGWPGVKLTNLFVDVQRAGFQLSAKEAVVRAGIGGLWPPRPSYSGSLDSIETGGDLWFKYAGAGNYHDVSLEAEELGCSLLSFRGSSPPVSGKLDAEADLSLNLGNLQQTSGYLELSSKDFEIAAQNFQQFFKLPFTRLNKIKAKIDVRNGVAKITSFEFGDDSSDLKGKLTGELRLGRNLAQSNLDLRLDVSLSESYAANPLSNDLKGFLGGYRVKGEEYAMKWNSSIGQMQSNLFSAIPQKVQ